MNIKLFLLSKDQFTSDHVFWLADVPTTELIEESIRLAIDYLSPIFSISDVDLQFLSQSLLTDKYVNYSFQSQLDYVFDPVTVYIFPPHCPNPEINLPSDFNGLFINSFYPSVLDSKFKTQLLTTLQNSHYFSQCPYLDHPALQKNINSPINLFGHILQSSISHISTKLLTFGYRSNSSINDFIQPNSKDTPWVVFLGASASLNYYSPDSNTFSNQLASLDHKSIQIGLPGSTVSDSLNQIIRLLLAELNISTIIWYGGFNDFAYGLRNDFFKLQLSNWIESAAAESLVVNYSNMPQPCSYQDSPPKIPSTPPQAILRSLVTNLRLMDNLCKQKSIKFYPILQPSLASIALKPDSQYDTALYFSSPQYQNNFVQYIDACYRLACSDYLHSFYQIINIQDSSLFRDVVHVSPRGDRMIFDQFRHTFL